MVNKGLRSKNEQLYNAWAVLKLLFVSWVDRGRSPTQSYGAISQVEALLYIFILGLQ